MRQDASQFRVRDMQSAPPAKSFAKTSHSRRLKTFRILRTDIQHLVTGAVLFEPGQQRRLYRVESGAICHYMRPADHEHEIIEFAFPGDIIGLGHSTTHVSTAKAMVETNVSIITDADLDRALQKRQ